MKDGFIKVAAGTPPIRVADCAYNAAAAARLLSEAADAGVALLVLPELGLCGYTCGDLFLQPTLLAGALDALQTLRTATASTDTIVVCGLPLAHGGKLYNCAAVLYHGKILGVVPKTHLPNYGEFYEKRWFSPAPREPETLSGNGLDGVPFGSSLLFCCDAPSEFVLAVELCEDLWAVNPPSSALAGAGATVIANLSASNETAGKATQRRSLVCAQSARLLCGYLYANAGEGESTTDLVFAGHNLIVENGTPLAESAPFSTGLTISELDVARLQSERRRMTTFPEQPADGFLRIPFSLPQHETPLTRKISPTPFFPEEQTALAAHCAEILNIQSHGLKKRLAHSHAKSAVIGISGGLDSTLALLVAVRTLALLQDPALSIVAVTMPCFGTTSRTKGNAELLCERLDIALRQIDITASVERHFADIGQNPAAHDVTFENAQARERTQVLMDIANQTGGLVIGTGDLSELALGWATYNGDHMSMYGVNASVPKTLVRHLVAYEAAHAADPLLREVLLDILDTPVSPELLPPVAGEIEQKTEHLVGPYALHDFFLFYVVRYGFPPAKVLRLALCAFGDSYSAAEISRWLSLFYRRFFSQQFKRSCLPDGPKAGPVSLSPRGDWRMPSDACAALWMDAGDAGDAGDAREREK